VGSGLKNLIAIWLELSKMRITIAVSVTCMVGYLLKSGSFDFIMIWAALGTFLCSAGASSLNHYQEREYDALMSRTARRPLVVGLISPNHALIFALVLIGLGYLILLEYTNELAATLGIFNVVLYNTIYTPLKRKSSLAVLPGALVGAVPPVIGWVTAGGGLFDLPILGLATFVFMWQMPHFWLLALVYAEDYKAGGFPMLTGELRAMSLQMIIFIWIGLMIIFSLAFPLFNIIFFAHTTIVIFLLTLWIFWKIKILLRSELEDRELKKIFLLVNEFVLLVLIIISVDRLI
jgi:heme o synthase